MEIAMKVETSTATKLHITGAVSLAPNTVFLEDLKPKGGKITVSRWGKSWTAFWGGMWDGMTVGQFFAGSIQAISIRRFVRGNSVAMRLPKKLAAWCTINGERSVMTETKRALYDETDYLRDLPLIDHLHGTHSELMQKLFGNHAERLGRRGLCRIPKQ